MIITDYRFRFSLLGSVLALIGISIFFSLGTWQVNRAQLKQNLQEEIDSRKNSAEIVIQSSRVKIEGKSYTPTKAIGYYDPVNEILIDNEIYQGKAGYHVLTPLILKVDRSVVMVNRGWVPVGRSRQILPVISTPSGEITVFGRLSPYKSKPALILDQASLGSTRVWSYFDKAVYAEKTGYKLLSAMILMEQSRGEGYIRKWPKYNAKVNMHIGYAIQWYFFAAVILVAYVSINLKKK